VLAQQTDTGRDSACPSTSLAKPVNLDARNALGFGPHGQILYRFSSFQRGTLRGVEMEIPSPDIL
jgi:hypothetical protein